MWHSAEAKTPIAADRGKSANWKAPFLDHSRRPKEFGRLDHDPAAVVLGLDTA
jgi:hypothetical protein